MNVNLKDLGISQNAYTYMSSTKRRSMNGSELIYEKLGIPLLKKLGLDNQIPTTKLEKFIARKADGKMAIDHIVKKNNQYATIQSRFRTQKYQDMSDITIRYDMPNTYSHTNDITQCEFFHLDADLFFYGITDIDSIEDAKNATKFIKWIILDLKQFRQDCKDKKIVANESISKPFIRSNTLHCNIKNNIRKNDTRLMIINIKLLYRMNKNIILAQHGFLNEDFNRINSFSFDNNDYKYSSDILKSYLNSIGLSLVIPKTDLEKYLCSISTKLIGNNIVKDKYDNFATLQIRSRNNKYKIYKDITLRYINDYEGEKNKSEFYTLLPDLLFYGIQENKNNFCKYTLINLKELKKLIKNKKIIIGKYSDLKDNILYCKISYNKNKNDSNFVSINISDLHKISSKVIIDQYGYF